MKYQKCPVCEGRGVVAQGFYNPYSHSMTSSLAPDKCKTCDGDGIILEPQMEIVELLAPTKEKNQ